MPPTDDASDLLTTQEVAALCRVAPSTVARWAKSGVLPGITIGPRTLRFRRSDVDRLVSGEPAAAS